MRYKFCGFPFTVQNYNKKTEYTNKTSEKWILLAKKAFKDDLFVVRRKVRT